LINAASTRSKFHSSDNLNQGGGWRQTTRGQLWWRQWTSDPTDVFEVDEGLYSSRSLGVSFSVFDEVQISSALSILPPPTSADVLYRAPHSQPHPTTADEAHPHPHDSRKAPKPELLAENDHQIHKTIVYTISTRYQSRPDVTKNTPIYAARNIDRRSPLTV
jgi:hypothetical protein